MLRSPARSLIPTFGRQKADQGDDTPNRQHSSSNNNSNRAAGLGQLVLFCVILPLCTVFWQAILLPGGVLSRTTASSCLFQHSSSSASVPLVSVAQQPFVGHIRAGEHLFGGVISRGLSSPSSTTAHPRPSSGVATLVTANSSTTVPSSPASTTTNVDNNTDGMDASWDTIQYSLQLWDIFLKTHVPEYEPGQHGITQPKYAGLKARLFYDAMVKARRKGLRVKTICEVGMYAGASSQFFLLANKDAHLYTFDTFSKGKMLSKLAANTMVKMGRATTVVGSSLDTVPEFPKKYPGVLCDVVFIDGSKKYEFRLQDLANFRAVSHKDTLVLLDEVCSNECVRNGPESACREEGTRKNFATACMAYRTTVQRGEMEIHQCLDLESLPAGFPKNDYVCSAKFLYGSN